MAKLTILTPVLVEKTCEKCGDGLIRYKQTIDDGDHLFKKTKYTYEYVCEKCGETIHSDKPFVLREIFYIDEKTRAQYRVWSNNVLHVE